MERLDKLLASQGMLSRREVKELITKGRVTIDGTVEKHPERKVTGEEQIVVAGELLRVQRPAPTLPLSCRNLKSWPQPSTQRRVLKSVSSQWTPENNYKRWKSIY